MNIYYMVKVSVIIPSYNRFNYLLNTINSVKKQTFTDYEIIVVNDCSTDPDYYWYDWKASNINIIHLKENTRKIFGFPCVGYVINQGIKVMKGEYFSTCDDDDIWLPRKLELQLIAMQKTGCKMSSTDGFIGKGIYHDKIKYKKYNGEYYFKLLQDKYKKKGKDELANGFPDIWNLDFLKIHNCMIACSVMIHKDIIQKIGNQLEIKMGGVIINNKAVHIDYDYWLRALKHTNSVYVKEPCFYYDTGHGAGQEWKK